MNQVMLEIESNRRIAEKTYEMKLCGDVSEISYPGQFVNFRLKGFFLRRPISVCDFQGDKLTVIYKVVGNGTEKMSRMKPGENIDTLTGLGNGYRVENAGENPLLVGGGAGVPPLYALAKRLKNPTVVMGFNTADEIFYKEEFEKIGAKVYISTADGSVGTKGFVTDVIKTLGDFSYVYTCGPKPMLRAVYDVCSCGGEFSFEERMGCGFGACMGCSCKTKYGNKRICKDGPVLLKEEIIW